MRFRGGSGIGRAAAIAYDREGADVAINYQSAEEPDAIEVIALIEAKGRKAVAIPGDLRSEEFCRSLITQAAEQLGDLDILVNNAALQQTRPCLAEISSELLDDTMKTNVYAPFWLTKAALEHMDDGAVIVNTSSEQAGNPSSEIVHYAVTRAAVLNFTKVWRRNWRLAAPGSTPWHRGPSGRRFRCPVRDGREAPHLRC